MYEKIKRSTINNWMFLLLFILFYIILRVCPMMYDGWAGHTYYNNMGGIIQWINYMRSYYIWINGRLASTFVSGILESFPSELILDFVNALVMTLICWSLCEIFRIYETKKKLFITIIFYALIFFVPDDVRVYVIQIANTAYIPPVLLCCLFYLVVRKYLENPNNAPRWLLSAMCVLAFCICTWLEHIAVGFEATFVIVLLFLTFRDRKIYWYLWIAAATALISILIMMLAPSLSANRTIIDQSSVTVTLLNNIKNLYRYMLRDNMRVSAIFFAILAYTEAKYGWKKNILHKILCVINILITVILIMFIFTDKLYSIPTVVEYLNRIYYGMVNNLIPSVLGIIFFSSLAVSGSLLSVHRKPLVLMGMVAICALGPICITPQLSSRVSSFGVFIQICICIGLISDNNFTQKTKLNKIVVIGIICLGIIAADKEVLLFRRINNITTQRQKIIDEVVLEQKMGTWDYDNDQIRLPIYNLGDVYKQGLTFEGSFHYPLFLNRYGLASKTQILFTNSDYYSVSIKQDGSLITFHVDSNFSQEMNKKYYYRFTNGDGLEIFNSITAVEQDWTGNCPSGVYNVQAYICTMAEDGKTINTMELIDQAMSVTVIG